MLWIDYLIAFAAWLAVCAMAGVTLAVIYYVFEALT
jgi:cbb3-type cytochrome oxidase subunit 3